MFGSKPYVRSEVLAEADRARVKGRRAKAIAAYRRILEHEPQDFGTHAKLAPLLVDDDPKAAWDSFEHAARGHEGTGFTDRALAVYRQAADALPFVSEAWERIAALHALRGRRADALDVLLEGQSHFWSRRASLPNAVRLLEQALALDPWHLEATLALARAKAKLGERRTAVEKLNALMAHLDGHHRARRRILGVRLRVAPSFRHVFQWLAG